MVIQALFLNGSEPEYSVTGEPEVERIGPLTSPPAMLTGGVYQLAGTAGSLIFWETKDAARLWVARGAFRMPAGGDTSLILAAADHWDIIRGVGWGA